MSRRQLGPVACSLGSLSLCKASCSVGPIRGESKERPQHSASLPPAGQVVTVRFGSEFALTNVHKLRYRHFLNKTLIDCKEAIDMPSLWICLWLCSGSFFLFVAPAGRLFQTERRDKVGQGAGASMQHACGISLLICGPSIGFAIAVCLTQLELRYKGTHITVDTKIGCHFENTH